MEKFKPFIAGVILGGLMGYLYGFDKANQKWIDNLSLVDNNSTIPFGQAIREMDALPPDSHHPFDTEHEEKKKD